MTLGLVLEIGGALFALAIGLWLGMPGRYTQSAEDIEKIMESGGRRRRRTKRTFTPLAWVQRKVTGGSRNARRGRARRGFRLESPEDRESSRSP